MWEWAWFIARRYDDAIAQFETTLDVDASFGEAWRYLGLTYLQRSVNFGTAAFLRADGDCGRTSLEAQGVASSSLVGPATICGTSIWLRLR